MSFKRPKHKGLKVCKRQDFWQGGAQDDTNTIEYGFNMAPREAQDDLGMDQRGRKSKRSPGDPKGASVESEEVKQ